MNSDKKWVVYLVQCSDKSLYCGITNNLKKRLDQHNLGKGAKYTRSRTPVALFGTSPAMTKSDALKLEHRVKVTPASRKRIELESGKATPGRGNTRTLQEIQKIIHSIIQSMQELARSVLNIATAVEKLSQADSAKVSPEHAV